MQIRISELMDGCCPETVELGSEDKALARRIDASVMAKIGAPAQKPRHTARKTFRTLLLAAALTALLSTAAYAVGGYYMNLRRTDGPESGKWVELAADGTVLSEQKLVYPDAGMVLSFEGPAERSNTPEFRCWYLPSEATFGYTDAEGWATYLSDNGEGRSIPYVIGASSVWAGKHKSVINGEVVLVKEDDWDGWHVTELTSDYTNCSLGWAYDRANFVLLFNAEKGWLIEICGTAELETLEHIARELEIRDSGERPYHEEAMTGLVETIGMIDPGRG
ncbi:MAG: hypothetical protein K6F56_04080 [Oscillospiraceae bacterium]|nr:hypothetical protein [Oscillospiraceae bacterium]